MQYDERAIGEFLSAVASARVAPAGGTAAAIIGAIGASLVEMAARHTMEAGARNGETAALADAREGLEEGRRRLLDLADADSRAVDELVAGEDGAGPTERKRATGVPLAIAEACLEVLELGAVVTGECNPNLAADAAVGVLLAHSALRGAVLIVRSNVAGLDDAPFAEEMEGRAAEIAVDAEDALERAGGNVGMDL